VVTGISPIELTLQVTVEFSRNTHDILPAVGYLTFLPVHISLQCPARLIKTKGEDP
jgi:hypothetical protein